MSKHNFVFNRPKFTKFLLFNAGETLVDNAVGRLIYSRDICGQIKRCPKSCRILDVFCLPNV